MRLHLTGGHLFGKGRGQVVQQVVGEHELPDEFFNLRGGETRRPCGSQGPCVTGRGPMWCQHELSECCDPDNPQAWQRGW